MKRRAQVFSIFGQTEALVTNMMIEEGKLGRKIPLAEIPPSVQFNDQHQPAKFAVIVPPQFIAEFERRIQELRA